MCGLTQFDQSRLLFWGGLEPVPMSERRDGRDHLRLAHSGFRVVCCADLRRIAREKGEERTIEILRALLSDEAATVDGMSKIVKEAFGS